MSSESGWIPWDEREGVKKYVVKVGIEYDDDDNEIYTFSYIGAIPDVYIKEFKEFVVEASDDEIDLLGYDLILFEDLNEQDKKEALECYIQNKYEIAGDPFRIFKIALEQKDKDFFDLLHKQKVPSNNIAPTVPSPDHIANDPQADIDYTKIKDHKERRYTMFINGMGYSEICKWEKDDNNRRQINYQNKQCPTSSIDGIKKAIERYRKGLENNGTNQDK